MKYGILFGLVAVLLEVAAVMYGGAMFLLIWPAVSFTIVAAGYLHFGPRIYGKAATGLLPAVNQILLLPFLLFLWSVWYAVRLVRREPAVNQLTENLFIGRRLLSHELPPHIDHVIDLTCEFNEPTALRSASYFSFPILDGFAPSTQQLRKWAQTAAALSGNVYIHCAEGHGRTGLFAAVLLFQTGAVQSAEQALQLIQSKRPLVRLGKRQLAVLLETTSPENNA